MTIRNPITRFAPSPTGRLHIGNARTALFNWLLAAGHKGEMIIRIEDTDAERSRREHEDAMLADLRWMSVHWEQGPDVGGAHGPYRQSERGEIYEKYYRQLEAQQEVYPCFCSAEALKLERKAQLAAGKPPRYSGTCAKLSASEIAAKRERELPATLRYRVKPDTTIEFTDLVHGEQRFAGSDIGDFIIRRADGSPAFFFSNAIDDAMMGVTHALRGEDHLANTPRQLMLLASLGLPAPTYGHFALVQDTDGSGLSKRLGSLGIADLRDAGYLPLALLNYLSRLGHSYAVEGFKDVETLAREFDPQRLGRAPARFDPVQLDHWQKEAVHRLAHDAMLAWVKSHDLQDTLAGFVPGNQLDAFIATIKDNVVMPNDALDWARQLFADNAFHDDDAVSAIHEAGADFFVAARSALEEAGDFKSFSQAIGARTGSRGKALFMPLRAAMSGVTHGPEMARLFDLLGKTRIRDRLEMASRLAAGKRD